MNVTSPDRVLWRATGFTKRDLVDYYAAVADALVPHLSGRPLTLGRYPNGVDAPGFAQTECRGRPEWMATKTLRLRSGAVRRFCVVEDPRSLVWVANLGTVELHPYLGGGPDGEDAVLALFDLDPVPGAGPVEAARAALRVRELLAGLGLAAFAKTSGSLGVHVFVPLNVPHPYAQVRTFCEEVAARLHDAGVRVDCAQNHPRRSLVAPYSLRAARLPTVSAALTWQELERAAAERRGELVCVTAEQMPERIERLGDPFAAVLEVEQELLG